VISDGVDRLFNGPPSDALHFVFRDWERKTINDQHAMLNVDGFDLCEVRHLDVRAPTICDRYIALGLRLSRFTDTCHIAV
jgi:hypothetical protein